MSKMGQGMGQGMAQVPSGLSLITSLLQADPGRQRNLLQRNHLTKKQEKKKSTLTSKFSSDSETSVSTKDSSKRGFHGLSSYSVFIKHFEIGGAEAVLGKACFDEWVASRKSRPQKPEESFRKAITAHLCKASGRRPFTPEVEAAILKIVRQKKPWPMAVQLNLTIGANGFRAKGYHEQRELEAMDAYDNRCRMEAPFGGETKTPCSAKSSSVGLNPVHMIPSPVPAPGGGFHAVSPYGQQKRNKFGIPDFKESTKKRKLSDQPLPGDERNSGPGEAGTFYGSYTQKPDDLEFALALFSAFGITLSELEDHTNGKTVHLVSGLLSSFSKEDWDVVKDPNCNFLTMEKQLLHAAALIEMHFSVPPETRNFLCPVDQFRTNFGSSSVGKIQYDLRRKVFMDQDSICSMIFGRELLGLPLSAVHVERRHLAFTVCWAIPVLNRNKRVWVHFPYLRPDGRFTLIRSLWQYPAHRESTVEPATLDVFVQDASLFGAVAKNTSY